MNKQATFPLIPTFQSPINSRSGKMKTEINIEITKSGSVPEIASVVAKAMLTNPLHMAVFKSADARSLKRQTRLFETVLKQPNCNLLLATHDGRPLGVMNYYLPGQCQINPVKTFFLLPALIRILGSRLPAVLKWKAAWSKHDPQEPHLHFGPLAVLPEYQGLGIGSVLLMEFCLIADSRGLPAWLETDKKENIPLYEKFGFEVVSKNMLHGVPNWFMHREALPLPK